MSEMHVEFPMTIAFLTSHELICRVTFADSDEPALDWFIPADEDLDTHEAFRH
jgi:hypothetical protein